MEIGKIINVARAVFLSAVAFMIIFIVGLIILIPPNPIRDVMVFGVLIFMIIMILRVGRYLFSREVSDIVARSIVVALAISTLLVADIYVAQPDFSTWYQNLCSQGVRDMIAFFFLATQIVTILLMGIMLFISVISSTSYAIAVSFLTRVLDFFVSKFSTFPEFLLLYVFLLMNTHTLFTISFDQATNTCQLGINSDFQGAVIIMIIIGALKSLGFL